MEHMKIEHWSIEKLIPYARNPRKNDHAVDRVASAIREFGFRVPIIARSDGTVVDGHLRLKAAQKLKLKTVPVVLADDMTDTQIRAFRISVNRMAELAEWDTELLSLEIEDVKLLGVDISLTGFDAPELKNLLGKSAGNTDLTDPDAIPDQNKTPPTCKRGEIWILGDHRMMCGDSTSEADVARLMAGQKADMVFTDPPYNLASDSKMFAGEKTTFRKVHKGLKESGWDDNFDVTPAVRLALSLCKPERSAYFCTSQYLIAKILDEVKREDFFSTVVWCKSNPMPSLSKRCWTFAHELIVYCHSGKHVFNFPKDGHALSWWDIKNERHTENHPTQKPVYVSERAILHSSSERMLVIDLFLGSGSTLIACEKTGRRCFGMEISPTYCDVIIKRWEDFTGRKAIRSEEI